MTRASAVRALAAAGSVLLLAAVAVLVAGGDDGPGPPARTTSPTSAAAPPSPRSPPSPGARAAGDLTVLDSAAAAERAGAERVLAAGLAAAAGAWSDLGHAAWPPVERPVYVGSAGISGDRTRVTADVAVAFRTDSATSEIVLRLLGAATPLRTAGATLDLDVRFEGAPVAHRVDGDGARVIVVLDDQAAPGQPVLLRFELDMTLADRAALHDDGTPATAGLIAAGDGASTLGHWLPLLTIPGDDGPMLALGDVGAFPAAVWSLRVTHPGLLLTGGVEEPCTGAAAGCTQARGLALRDLSAVVLDTTAATAGTTVRVAAPASTPGLEAAAAEAADAAGLFADLLGPLPWPQLDLAVVPLGPGAAGMEFPGLMLLDDRVPSGVGGGFGTYVLVHEVAHQWFHALVGSGSLSSPVIDESLAQYLTYVYEVERRGQAAGDAMLADYVAASYRRARANGLVDEPPAQGLAEFDSRSAYGALVYGRGALAWVAAEDAVGRGAVLDFLADLVDRAGLGFVDAAEVVAAARRADPRLGDVLDRWWFDPRPVPVP